MFGDATPHGVGNYDATGLDPACTAQVGGLQLHIVQLHNVQLMGSSAQPCRSTHTSHDAARRARGPESTVRDYQRMLPVLVPSVRCLASASAPPCIVSLLPPKRIHAMSIITQCTISFLGAVYH